MRKVIICIVFNILFVQLLVAQNTNLFVSMRDLDNNTTEYLKNNNIKQVNNILGQYIYKSNGLELMEAPFKAEIKRQFPNSNASGYCMIDWEGKGYDALKDRTRNPQAFTKALSEFKKAITIAKQMRPNVKWGFFSLPFRKIYGRNSYSSNKLLSLNTNIAQLLQLCDVLFPTAYYSYADIGNQGKALILDDVKSSLKIGAMYNKPVMPVVWNRASNGNSLISSQLIPDNNFLALLQEISKVEYNDTKVSGIVWWSGDVTFYRNGNSKLRKEARDIDDFKSKYQNRVKQISSSFMGKKN